MVNRVIAAAFALTLLAGCELYDQELPDKTDAGADMLVDDDAMVDGGPDGGTPDGETLDGTPD